jgi:hypothetical protein
MSSLLKHKFALHGVDPPISVNPHPPVGDALSFAVPVQLPTALKIAMAKVASERASRCEPSRRDHAAGEVVPSRSRRDWLRQLLFEIPRER